MFFTGAEFALESASELEVIRAFLLKALTERLKGNSDHYDYIVGQLQKRDDADMLWKVLIGLCSCVSHLTNRSDKYSQLINAVFSYDWSGSDKVSVAYLNLTGHLVSSNATFLIPCFEFLVHSFTLPELAAVSAAATAPPSSSASASSSSPSSSSSSALSSSSSSSSVSGATSGLWLDASAGASTAHTAAAHRTMDRIHQALFKLMQLAPTGQAELFPILARAFPHKRQSLPTLSGFAFQLLRVCEYLPLAQAQILDLLVLKCLEMDVEIVIEDSGEVRICEEAEEDEDGMGSMFVLDEEAHRASKYLNRDSREGVKAIDMHTPDAAQRIPDDVAEKADKLDAVLSILLHFVDRRGGPGQAAAAGGSGSPGVDDTSERLFHQLLNVFEDRVLVTHRSKFVQFVLFYFSARSERFGAAFAGRLLRCFLDPASSPVKQQSAVLYLGSFLSRAAFLPVSCVCESVAELVCWGSDYVANARADTPVSLALASRVAHKYRPLGGQQTYAGVLIGGSGARSTDSTTSSASSASDGSAPILGLPLSAAALGAANVPGLSAWHADMTLRARDRGSRSLAIQSHETYYYCMQAVFYTYCFLGTDLITALHYSPRFKHVLPHLERSVASSLDPLRFCLASVRGEFLRLVVHVNLISQACLGSVARDLLPEEEDAGEAGAEAAAAGAAAGMGAGMGAGTGTGARVGGPAPLRLVLGARRGRPVRSLSEGLNPLETFFPFDPCLLRRLHQPIQPSYRPWSGVPGLSTGPLREGSDEGEGEGEGEEDSCLEMDRESDAYGENEQDAEQHSQTSTHSHASSQRGSYLMDLAMTDHVGHDHYLSASTSTSLASSHATQTSMYMYAHAAHSPSASASYGSGHGHYSAPALQEVAEADRSDALAMGLGGAGLEAGGLPFRRPRQYSVGSTGSF